MSNLTPPEGWERRIRETIELSKLMLRYGSREDLLAWGYDPEMVNAVLAYREFKERS